MKMNILLTNDDGYNHPGLLLLRDILKEYGDVTVVAPRDPQSAKSCSLTIHRGLDIVELENDYYHVDGTPADCVKVALFALNRKFDLVVSGCNDGHNISYDTSYSGTVGACLEAQFHSIPAIALSTDFDHFEIVKKEARNVFNFIRDHKLVSRRFLLNVNFPSIQYSDSKGIKITSLYMRKDHISFAYKDGVYYSSRKTNVICSDPDCDYRAVHDGYISITPLKPNYFDEIIYQEFKKRLNK